MNHTVIIPAAWWPAARAYPERYRLAEEAQIMNHTVAGSLDTEWEPTRWWRVIRNGELWCETSSEAEARRECTQWDVLQRLWRIERFDWRTEAKP